MARILIVDAGAVNRRFVATLLRNRGHRASEASNRAEVLQAVRAETPDLALVDVALAGLDGIQLVLDLRRECGLSAQRVVLRAAADLEAEARALADTLGAEFVAKPANPDALVAAVEAALAKAAPSRGERAAEALLAPLVGIVRRCAERADPLETARAALEQEIRKRLLAEQQLSQSILGLRDQALRDPLTGLHNRRYLDESLDREESRALRSRRPFAVLMIDVDHFKRFNDTLGHAAGDAVLCAVARHIASVARGEDIVARYGGDEFALVMAQTARDTALQRARTLCADAQRLEIECAGKRVGPVALSAGIGVYPDHGESGVVVLQAADAALTRCKRSGRGTVLIAG